MMTQKKQFLNLPIPDGPIPHDNKTGTDWMRQYGWQSDFFKNTMKKCALNFLTLIVKISLIAIGIYTLMNKLNLIM